LNFGLISLDISVQLKRFRSATGSVKG